MSAIAFIYDPKGLASKYSERIDFSATKPSPPSIRLQFTVEVLP